MFGAKKKLKSELADVYARCQLLENDKHALLDKNAMFTALDKSLAVIEFDPFGNIWRIQL